MGSPYQPYIPTGPDLPPAPLDVPIPNIPPASFQTIGSDIATGINKSAILPAWLQTWVQWIPDFIGAVVGALVGLIEQIIAWLLKIMFKIFAGSEAGTAAISSVALSGMFNIPVSNSDLSTVGQTGGPSAASQSVVGAIMKGLTGQMIGQGPGSIQPTDKTAVNFMNLVTHMAIEGWLAGWLAEACSAGQIETFAELKDILERTMGLGRLAHSVLHPAVKTFISDPFTHLLNLTYRPVLLNPDVLIREFLRDTTGTFDLNTPMSWHGYTQPQITALVNMQRAHLSLGQLGYLVAHGTITTAQAQTMLQAQGYDANTAASVLYVEAGSRIDGELKAIADQAVEGFAQRKIDQPTLVGYLQNLGLPSNVQNVLIQKALLKQQLNVTRPSPGEGATLVKKGIWSTIEYGDLLAYHGYSLSDQADLELLILAEEAVLSNAAQAKLAAAAAKAKAAAAKAALTAQKAAAALADVEAKGVSIASFKALIADGLKTLSDYQTFLTLKGIAPDNVNALVQLEADALTKASAAAAAKLAKSTTTKVKVSSVAEDEQAVIDGVITMQDFQARLNALGYDATDSQLIVDVLTDKMAAAVNKAQALAATKAAKLVKHVNLAQYEHGVRIGLHSLADYTAFLQAAGYDAPDVTLLTSEMSAQLAADAAAAATKASALAAKGQKELSIAQLERSVRAGLATIADYQAALTKAGYDASSTAQLVSLLQLQLTTDQETKAASGRAAALMGAKGLSLADTQRLVKYGVVPIAQYTSQLIAAGLPQSDAQLLTLALTAQLGAVKKTTAKAPSIASLLTAQGLSLSRLETDVRSGLIPMTQFVSQLQGAGVSATDIQTISSLLQEEITAKAAAEAAKLTGPEKSARAGLTMAETEAAVKAGVLQLTDYATLLTTLGYSPANVQTLVNTLAASSAYQKLIAAAAAPTTTAGS